MSAATQAAFAPVLAHASRLRSARIMDFFAQEPDRVARFTAEAAGLTLDLSKEKLDAEALEALLSLARAQDVEGWRAKLYAGEAVNDTEGRAVLHMALRGEGPFSALGEPVSAEVRAVRARIEAFARAFRSGEIRGATGQPLDTIVHIGIGGSDLGPRLVYDALKPLRRFPVRFAGNVDGAEIKDALEGLDPARTLVVVVSKTFTTLETLKNAEIAKSWLAAAVGEANVGPHLAAVSAAPQRATAWGVAGDRVFPFWDWVGGRYSLWSAVSLSVECALEAGAFAALLAGAAEMDAHFRAAPLARNLPVLSALAHSWNRVALGAPGALTLPYARRLQLLPAFLQQLEMESNGKGVERDGSPVIAPAAGVTWGEPGTNAQHSFMQAIHQSALVVPVEILVAARAETDDAMAAEHQRLLNANALAQAEALLVGKPEAEAEAELRRAGAPAADIPRLAKHKTFSGDRPSTVIGFDRLTPETLGALLAFYEHRTFVQGVLMGVNSFDQWGVELGKQLATPIAKELAGETIGAHDPSTAAWIVRLRG